MADAQAAVDQYVFTAMIVGMPLLWAAVGYLTVLSFNWIPQILLLLHYVSALAVVGTSLPADVTLAPEGVFIWAAVYLAGQVILWRRIIAHFGEAE